MQERVLAVAGAAVVVAVVEREQRAGRSAGTSCPAGGPRPCTSGCPGVVRRRRAEEPDPLPADLIELAVVVRVLRQREDPHQFAADEQVVVDGQFVPRLEPDARPGRVVVAEGRVRLRRAAQQCPRHRLAGRVEDFDRPDRPATRPGGRRTSIDEPLALLRGEPDRCASFGFVRMPSAEPGTRSSAPLGGSTHDATGTRRPSPPPCRLRRRSEAAPGRATRRPRPPDTVTRAPRGRPEVDALDVDVRGSAARDGEREHAGHDRHVADVQAVA